MSDPNDPTRSQVPPHDEPATSSALTHSHAGDPGTATAHPNPSTVGSEPLPFIPGFDVTRELGGGGMGVVYEARQTRLNRPVALKVLREARGSKQDIVRFLTEAEAVAAVKHPHTVQVFEFGQHGDRPFMVLELLTGGTLSDRVAAGKFEPLAAAELLAKLADAVQAAHDLGIVHRDLKPGNVLFDDRGEPKVTDFGLAKRTGGADLTRTQAVMGTPAYMAPEQARGDAKFVGPAADVWALGAILYECLTGKRPFDADDTWALLRKVTDEAPPRPRSLAPALPRDLELIALKCLEKQPAGRYPTAAALADDLRRFLAGQPVSVRPAGPTERFVKWVRRNPVVAGFTAALVFVAVAGFAAVTWALWQTEKREKELAKSNGDLKDSRDTQRQLVQALKSVIDSLQERTLELTTASATAEKNGYLSDVALAHQLWKANDLPGMRAALKRCPADWWNWEWYYLDRLSRPSRALYPTDSLPTAVAYSPDGALLAYGTLSGTLVVRELGSDKEKFRIEPQVPSPSRHGSLVFRPSGGELAYVVAGGVYVLDLVTGKSRELAKPTDQPGNPRVRSGSQTVALGYTAGGELLAAASTNGAGARDRAFTIRDANTGKVLATLPGYEEPPGVVVELSAAVFSPDATRFAVSAIDTGIRVNSKDEPAKLELFRPLVQAWDVATGKLLRKVEGGTSILGQLAFSTDGTVLSYSDNSRVLELDAGRDKLIVRPVAGARAVAFGPGGLNWSGGESKVIRADDYSQGLDGHKRFELHGCPNSIVRLTVSPGGNEVAAAVGDLLGGTSAVLRFDVQPLTHDTWTARAGRGRVSLVTGLAPDGARFSTCEFALDKMPEGPWFTLRSTTNGTAREVKDVGLWFQMAFRPDGGLLALDRTDRLLVIEPDGKVGKPFSTLPRESPGIRPALACSPDGKTYAAVATPRAPAPTFMPVLARLHSWDAPTLKASPPVDTDLSAAFPPKCEAAAAYPTGAAFDATGRHLGVSFAIMWQTLGRTRLESRGAVVVWDVAAGKEVFRKVTDSPLHAVAFDPKGRVVTGGGSASGGVVLGWDTGTGAEAVSLRGHTRPITSLAFGPDDRLATGGSDRVVKVWDVPSTREVLTLDGFEREVTHLAFTKDGANLVAGTGMATMSLVSMTGVSTEWSPAEVRVFRSR